MDTRSTERPESAGEHDAARAPSIAAELELGLDERTAAGLRRRLGEPGSGGRVDFASNDYLGLF